MERVEPCPKCLSKDIWFRRKESLNGNEREYCEIRCADCNYTLDLDFNAPESLKEARNRWNEHAFTEAKKGLKYCPFCGSLDLRIDYMPEKLTPNGGCIAEQAKYSIHCNKCDGNGGDHGYLEKAIKHWNTRY